MNLYQQLSNGTDTVIDYLRSRSSNLITLMKENALKIAGAGLVGFTFVYLGKIWYAYGTFKRMGIPTPDYKFIYGNFYDFQEKVTN
jgi:hypothetical protein